MNRNACHAFCDQSSKQLEQAKCRVVAHARIKERDLAGYSIEKLLHRKTDLAGYSIEKLLHRKTDLAGYSMKMGVFFTFMLPILAVIIFGEAAAAAHDPIFKPGCRVTKCGDMNISFPFGIGMDCYMDASFSIDCDKGSTPPRAIISSIKMEVLRIDTGKVYVKSPIFYSNCSAKDQNSSIPDRVTLTGTPFFFSDKNIFLAVGCNTRALLTTMPLVGCESTCRNLKTQKICSGSDGCCYASMPADPLQSYEPKLGAINVGGQDSGECRFAFLADGAWFIDLLNGSHPRVLQRRSLEYASVALAWIPDGSWKFDQNVMKCDSNIFDASINSDLHLECSCASHYQGSPYLQCSDINECNDRKLHSCRGIKECKNTVGSYRCETKLVWIISIVAAAAVIGVLLWLAFSGIAFNVMNNRKNTELERKNFERNGGLLLQQRVSSTEEAVQKMKIFTLRELEEATDGFNENRVLGIGSQGTVYRGVLRDGGIVAVKKSTVLDESKVEVFINEVAILSQINHRNVVRLLGCCLETEVPHLVYEFISNGTLFQYLHDRNEDFPLTWEVRLRIATEVAGAVAYLHSEASIPIYHRDIKTTNILLDEKFSAKVSDFGTSKWMDLDKTHLTTLVKGTFGYFDPEYFGSGRLTEKSDVYSFGVVLVELLSGKKPILPCNTEEVAQSLAYRFICLMEEGSIYELLDDMVKEHSHEQQVIAVANLAQRCLDMRGKNRPTMREVMVELEKISQTGNESNGSDVAPTSSTYGLDRCRSFPSEVNRHTLITNTI